MMKSNRFIGNESNLDVPDMANMPNVQKKRSFLTSTFAKGAALLLAASVTLGGCPGPTDPSGGKEQQGNGTQEPGGNNQPGGSGMPNGFTGNERVEGMSMDPNGIHSQELATYYMTRAMTRMLKQSQIIEAQYATLDGDTADAMQAIAHNISGTFQQTDRISTGRDSIPGYVTQMVDTLAPNTTNPDLFRKMMEAQQILMTFYAGGFTVEESLPLQRKWADVVAEVNDMNPNAQLSTEGVPLSYLVPQVAELIPTGANGAKFPEDISTHMMDLYQFHSFAFALKNVRGYNIDVPR
jgi:hypothetical protein